MMIWGFLPGGHIGLIPNEEEACRLAERWPDVIYFFADLVESKD